MNSVASAGPEGPPIEAAEGHRPKAVITRAVSAAISACIAGVWTGPWIAAALFAAVVIYEGVLIPPLQPAIDRLVSIDRRRAELYTAGLLVIGSSLHMAPFVVAWLIGGQNFAFVAALFLFGVLLHSLTFYSGNPRLFLATAAPPFAAAMVIPFFTTTTLFAAIMAVSCVHVLGVVTVAIKDRNRLNARALKFSLEAAQATQASDAKSQFVATMSHELRTPLNAVIGYAELMHEDIAAGRKPHGDDADRIAVAARTLLGLINDVLDLSKIEAGAMEPHFGLGSVTEIVQGAVDTCRHVAAANGTAISVQFDPRIDVVTTDSLRLRQCVLNLVSNACKFTKDGVVTVATRRVDHVDGARLQIAVTDTGIGMDAAQIKRVFEPFVQADASTTRAYGGTGLGLAITKRLCALLGGSVEMTSTPGVGTRCVIDIPAAPAALMRNAA